MARPEIDRLEIAGPLGTLLHSCVTPHSSTAALRAVKWHDDLRRLGIELPFVVVHDFGLALVAGQDQLTLGPRVEIRDALGRAQQGYQSLLDSVRASEAARRSSQLAMSDDLVVVVLARILGDVAQHLDDEPSYRAALPLDASLFEGLNDSLLLRMWQASDRQFEIAALEALAANRLLVITLVDALDVDTLRLFGLAGMSETGALNQVELIDCLATPEANDVVNFSLEILPSVLETKARPAASTFAAFGYSGLGLRGSIDNMVLTELAWDDDELTRRILDNEVLYYAREQQREQLGRQHLLLIDASASMRGDRATFARAIALATGKKLLLEGEVIAFRFFDSRLYEVRAAQAGQLPTPYILSFKGEHGRNPAHVAQELITLLDLRRQPEPLVVHLFTHAALYIPRELVSELKARAHLSAVFILPSGGSLDLDYLDLLDAHWVVDHDTLGQGRKRADAAREILGQIRTNLDRADAGPPSSRAPGSLRPSSRSPASARRRSPDPADRETS
jgi:hypothetical protein